MKIMQIFQLPGKRKVLTKRLLICHCLVGPENALRPEGVFTVLCAPTRLREKCTQLPLSANKDETPLIHPSHL